MPESEERHAESKVIPPKNPNIEYPGVAAIPPRQQSVVVIPKGPEVVRPNMPEILEHDGTDGVKTKVNLPKE